VLGVCYGIWKYKNFVWSSIHNDVINRFARSKFGGFWSLLNPLAQVIIYSLILSQVLGTKLPGVYNHFSYSVYLCAGTLAWSLFSEIINRSMNLFIEQGNLMKKVNFPRSTLPAIVVGSCLFNNMMLLMSIIGVMLILGHPITLAILWLIPLTVLTIIVAIGLGLILGIINIFIRDVGYVMPIILQIWFWFTPIVYPETILPESYRPLLNLNPLYPLIKAYQQVLVYGNTFQFEKLIVLSIVGIMLIASALLLFKRASAEIVDVL
jgi:lipopolysaccharide transport system permease protein